MQASEYTDEQLQQDIEAARNADAVLSHPVMKIAVEILKRRYRRIWEETDVLDAETRNQQFFKLRVLKEVMDELQALTGKGVVANVIREKRKRG
ncbi:MAG: hypothetical protein ABFE08_08990 [Armatimonadia bacterium]